MNSRSFLVNGLATGVLACATLAMAQSAVRPDQTAPAAAPSAADQAAQTTAAANAGAQATGTDAAPTVSVQPNKKVKVKKADRVVQTKATKKELRNDKKTGTLVGKDVTLPDKELYDKAMNSIKSGHFDIARLDLQTMLNTYPESTYQMRAKLAVADSWYEQGGSAELDQAEAEYKDFITFFPNVPEAALAQMRVGDIYFRQMDKSDRDGAAKALSAQTEYRLMIQQYPDSQFIPQAKQRLREVQETLADADLGKAQYYMERNNLAAAVARYQSLVQQYPEYSHMDQALIALGDCYMAMARGYRTIAMNGSAQAIEDTKTKLVKEYEDLAAVTYARVVLEHAAAPHVEDAKDRLADMGRPVPVPTPEQLAASTALENSRAQYNIVNRAALLFLHRPDVVQAARIGDPTMTDPKPVFAPEVLHAVQADQTAAATGKPVGAMAALVAGPAPATDANAPENAVAAPAPAPASDAPLAFGEIPTTNSGGTSGTTTITNASPSSAPKRAAGNSLGVTIINPGSSEASQAALPPHGNGGLVAVGPTDNGTAPPVEKAAEVPADQQQINDVKPGVAQPQAVQETKKNGKTKTTVDKKDESSSKKKPKKGLDKLNPF